MITAERVREVLAYDAETGVFTWRVSRSKNAKVGKVAGTKMKIGYVSITVDQHRVYAHRLAWFYTTGQWPAEQIDHINKIKTDNRISNLRPVSDQQNKQNLPKYRTNMSGVTGVTRTKGRQKWRAEIKVNGKQVHLGSFDNLDDAAQARRVAESKFWGVAPTAAASDTQQTM